MKKNNKGFTLVELIVVLVILAILAAILVPALLGYIDKARASQYEEEGHAILTAIQGYETEQYAKNAAAPAAWDTTYMKPYVDAIVDPAVVTSVDIYTGTQNGSNTRHKAFTVTGLDNLTFKSQDGKEIVIDFDGSAWSIVSIDGKAVSTGASMPSYATKAQ